MAASKSRQLEEAPEPPNTETRAKPSTKRAKQKGKEKERVPCTNSRIRDLSHSSGHKKSGIAWDWTVLTDPSASRTPPIYTKDGRHVVLC